MNVLQYLENRILENKSYPYPIVDKEYVAMYLCGVNEKIAENPFSKEFISNVAYNSDCCMAAILWLQLNAIN